jgi:ribosomal protein S18 acetylase RimI-like enzyme
MSEPQATRAPAALPAADKTRAAPDARTSAPACRLRVMDAPDLAAYKALRDLMLAAHPEAYTSDAETELRRPPETYLARVAGMADDGWPFTFTAWRGAWLCGALTCERDERVKVRHIGHLVGMMVHPDACGRGIGRALLEACIDRARGRGGTELLTLSVTSGSVAAIHLYESVGFVRYGRLERAVRIGSYYHHKDLMALRLEPAARTE